MDRLFQQLLEQPGGHPQPREIYGVHRNGTEFSAEVAASLVPDSGAEGAGSPTALLLSVRGTSHRKAADEDLREAMSLLTALTALECDSLQGYLFSLPEPGHRLEHALHHAEEALNALKGR